MDFEKHIIARDQFDVGIVTIVFRAGLAFSTDQSSAVLSRWLGRHDDEDD